MRVSPTTSLLAFSVRERHSAPAAGLHTPKEASVGVEAAVGEAEAGESGHFPHHLLPPGRVLHQAESDGPLVQDAVPAVLLQSDSQIIDDLFIQAEIAPTIRTFQAN